MLGVAAAMFPVALRWCEKARLIQEFFLWGTPHARPNLLGALSRRPGAPHRPEAASIPF